MSLAIVEVPTPLRELLEFSLVHELAGRFRDISSCRVERVVSSDDDSPGLDEALVSL